MSMFPNAWLFFFILICGSSFSHAGPPRYFSLQPVFKRNHSPGSSDLCRAVFNIPPYDLIKVEKGVSPSRWKQDASGHVVGAFPGNKRSPEVVDLVEDTLRDWKASGFYTNPQIDGLRRKEASIPPERAAYDYFSTGDQKVVIRTMEGSRTPLINGIAWSTIFATDYRTPIEKQHNYRFAERDLAHGGQIWELGLLSAPHFFAGGVKAVFHRLAQKLDKHYNMGMMGAFADTSMIEQNQMAIYGVARKALVEHYEALGFERVQEESLDGTMEDVVFDEGQGLYLIRMSGAQLLRLYFDEQALPSTPTHIYTASPDAQTDRNFLRLRNKLLQGQYYARNLSPLDAAQRYLQFAQAFRDIANTPGEAPEKWHRWRIVIEDFYIFWNSVPENFIPYGRWYEILHLIHDLLAIDNYHDTVEHANFHLAEDSLLWHLITQTYFRN